MGKNKHFPIRESFKTIFSSEPSGKKAAQEHIKRVGASKKKSDGSK